MVFAQLVAPVREMAAKGIKDARPRLELGRVTLSIVEAERNHRCETVQRPGEAGRRILASGEKDDSGVCRHRAKQTSLVASGSRAGGLPSRLAITLSMRQLCDATQ